MFHSCWRRAQGRTLQRLGLQSWGCLGGYRLPPEMVTMQTLPSEPQGEAKGGPGLVCLLGRWRSDSGQRELRLPALQGNVEVKLLLSFTF